MKKSDYYNLDESGCLLHVSIWKMGETGLVFVVIRGSYYHGRNILIFYKISLSPQNNET